MRTGLKEEESGKERGRTLLQRGQHVVEEKAQVKNCKKAQVPRAQRTGSPRREAGERWDLGRFSCAA